MTAVELSGVTLRFGARTVLADVDLTIGDNEFVGVLGPNGAGKTTLMRAILGLLPLSSGDHSGAWRDGGTWQPGGGLHAADARSV